jgi:hypothetical protein
MPCTNSAPSSNGSPSACTVSTRPPIRSRASTTVTPRPASATPAPITRTSVSKSIPLPSVPAPFVYRSPSARIPLSFAPKRPIGLRATGQRSWTTNSTAAKERRATAETQILEPLSSSPQLAPPEPPRRSGPAIVISLAIGLLAGILFAAGLAHVAIRSTTSAWPHVLSLITGRHTTLDVSGPAVIARIQKLSRLETVDYSIDKIVEGERQYALLPNFLTGDKLLLIAHGEVIAGVDLGQLKPGDLSIQGSTVTVHLPPAQILASRLDNQKTRVYSRSTGLLVSADPSLESTVRQAAEEQLTQAAIGEGILDKAHQNAESSVSALLQGLGFQAVHVN